MSSTALSGVNHDPATPVTLMSMPTTSNDSNAQVSKAKLALSSKVRAARFLNKQLTLCVIYKNTCLDQFMFVRNGFYFLARLPWWISG